MASAGAYATRYPRQGDVAILCEGDVAGFEVDLLEKWSALSSKENVLVDVWPCGTRLALSGMSDAIGRSRPIAVIEDRDYRSPADASTDCAERFQDRGEKRGVALRYWRAWGRHEIENYLIEPTVLVPVLAQRFSTSESAIYDRLGTIVQAAAVDQAAQWALYHLSKHISGSHPVRYIAGLPRKTARPRLDCSIGKIVAPEQQEVRSRLFQVIDEKLKLLQRDVAKAENLITHLIDGFEKRCVAWSSLELRSPDWLVDWAGKDLLLMLCRLMTWEFGWNINGNADLQKVNWDELEAAGKGSHARDLEREIVTDLQPRLVESFLLLLSNKTNLAIHDEWMALVGGLAQVAN